MINIVLQNYVSMSFGINDVDNDVNDVQIIGIK